MILHRYIARRFTLSFLATFGIFFAILGLLDLVEQIRRFGGQDVGFRQVIALTLLNIPEGLYRILPLVVILATIAMFLGLARSSELVVTRAAGRSALRALLAPTAVALVIGLVGIAMLNPIVAATMKEYESRAAALSQDDRSVLTLSDGGLWLRQGDAAGQTVIRAETSNLDGTELRDVTFLTFGPDGAPQRRIAARTAVLDGPVWALTDAKSWPLAGVSNPETEASQHDTLDLPSNLTAEQIRNSFGAPASIPIWDLPGFIDRLHEAGFAAKRHEVWLQMELALPGFLIAMVMIGAGFTMRHQRGGRTGVMVLAAILLGFGLYFIRNFAQILGENGQIPVLLAAWAPPLAAIGLALGLLLHLEDG